MLNNDVQRQMKAYLASGWFTEEQEKGRLVCLSAIINANWGVYSPKNEGLYIEGKSNPAKIFEIDVKEILYCDVVVANIMGLDSGTIFEMGYAFAKNKPILMYSSIKSKTNLMLAVSAYACFSTEVELKEYLIKWAEKWPLRIDKIPYEGDLI